MGHIRTRMDQGFTLVEIMMVVIILSLLSAWAVPAYEKAVERSEERVMVAQMQKLRAAFDSYHAKTGTWGKQHGYNADPNNHNWLTDDELQDVYGVKISDNNAEYRCFIHTAAEGVACFALSKRGFTLRFVREPNWNGYGPGTQAPNPVDCCGRYIPPNNDWSNDHTYGKCTGDCFAGKTVGLEIGDSGGYGRIRETTSCSPTCGCDGLTVCE